MQILVVSDLDNRPHSKSYCLTFTAAGFAWLCPFLMHLSVINVSVLILLRREETSRQDVQRIEKSEDMH